MMTSMKNNKGLTLVELVVAMAVAGAIMAAATMILVSGIRTYNLNLKSTESQQSLRTAMMKITKDVRKANKVEASGGTLTLDGNSFTVSDNTLTCNGKAYAENIKDITAELKNSSTIVEIVLTSVDDTTLSTKINVK